MREQINSMIKHANRVAEIYKKDVENITAEWCGELIDEHKADISNDTRAVYVGTWAKYNDGSLYGLWIDVDTFDSADEYYDFCKALHADESDPELMTQDIENIPKKFYSCESFNAEEYYEFCEEIDDEEERAICLEYWEEVDEYAEPKSIIDRLVYKGDEPNDYFDELAELYFPEISTTEIGYYFDYEAFRREQTMIHTITSNYIFEDR